MLPPPLLFHRIYAGTLQNRLDFSKSLHAALASQLPQDQAFAGAFATLRKAANTLARHMTATGMGQLCAACAASNPGGCCSREIAEETDAIQMLMNMLAGVEVEIADGGDGICCFLGSKGCNFIFKPMFCLNYNCQRILTRLGPDRAELEMLTGRLLGNQYAVEKFLLDRIKCLTGLAG